MTGRPFIFVLAGIDGAGKVRSSARWCVKRGWHGSIPPPILVLDFVRGSVIHPSRTDAAALSSVPNWAEPIVQASFELSDQRG